VAQCIAHLFVEVLARILDLSLKILHAEGWLNRLINEDPAWGLAVKICGVLSRRWTWDTARLGNSKLPIDKSKISQSDPNFAANEKGAIFGRGAITA